MSPLATRSCRRSPDSVRVDRLGIVDYLTGWDIQRALASARRAGGGPDVLMLLEHPSVYTAGKRTQPEDRPTDGTPVIDVDRGGLITWHGPGQLVGYPIIALAEPPDIRNYVRRLEEALIAVATGLGVDSAARVDGRSGVWLPGDDYRPERKIAAIGVRVAAGVTLHGFALNCNPDLRAFDRIVPCGIRDAGVSSLSAELGRDVGVGEVLEATADAVSAALDGAMPIVEHPIAARRAHAPEDEPPTSGAPIRRHLVQSVNVDPV